VPDPGADGDGVSIVMNYFHKKLTNLITGGPCYSRGSANNDGPLFWHLIVHIAIEKGKIRG
jgi:hypothetical protein